MVRGVLLSFLVVGLLSACGSKKEGEETQKTDKEEQKTSKALEYQTKDKHSYANVDEVRVNHVHLNLDVNFEEKVLSGSAVLSLNEHETEKLILDANNLHVNKVILDNGEETKWELGEKDKILGQPLMIDITPETKEVEVFYATDPSSKAIQWLNPQQTAGKESPYLFTQGEAILTRSWVPCQDSPGNRITYSADITVPKGLMAVMSATNPQKKNESGEYHFEMKRSVPCYLLALAVGNIDFQPLGPRTGVYTEPSMLEKSAKEFKDLEKMLVAAEGLYGKYEWDRYDVIVLPPSFPFGGMENPKLTFATPTIIAGDGSLVSLLAHEMAHSWSGNLVTNATWNDFWLNEGFTVYIENRIMEALYGKEYADMLVMLNYQGLQAEIQQMMEEGRAEDTHLKLDLKDRDPDEGMTAIAYDKGAFFLKTLEEAVGREKFDAFLRGYFKHFKFKTLTTEEFIAYLDEQLLSPNKVTFNVDEWIYGAGLPANCAQISSDRFVKVDDKIAMIKDDKTPSQLNVDEEKWTTHEWLHFINNLPKDLTTGEMKALDDKFGFKNSGNSEILAAWFVASVEREYWEVLPEMEYFLVHVGRRKFLSPIYKALSETEKGKEIALEIYTKARPNYHSISFNTMDEMLDYKKG